MRSGTIAFLLGVCGLTQLSVLPDSWICQLLPFVVVLIVYSRRWRLGALLVAGFLWAAFRRHLAMTGYLPPNLEGDDLLTDGRIVSISVQKSHGTQFVFEVTNLASHRIWKGKIRLTWYHPKVTLTPGQHWRLTVRLKRPHGFMNPAGFDYEKWLFQQRFGATGYVRGSGKEVLITESGKYGMTRVRGVIVQTIATVLGRHPQQGTVSALAVGHRQSISAQQWEVLRDTGTNHLMAISGLHIGWHVVAVVAQS